MRRPLVYPGHVEGQGGEREHQGAPDVTCAKYGHDAVPMPEGLHEQAAVEDERARSSGSPRQERARGGCADPNLGPGAEGPAALGCREPAHFMDALVLEDFGQEPDRTAAALSEFRAESVLRYSAQRFAACQAFTGLRDGLPFERSSADGAAEGPVRHDHHARSRFARAEPRTSTTVTSAQDGCTESVRSMVDHKRMGSGLHRVDRLENGASGVAGASSGGTRPGARLAIAWVIAENTDSASISGGSPTALERWTVGSRLPGESHRATRKSVGTSEQAGIL